MKKILNWFKKILPSKRKIIQVYAALLFNANLKGFGNGKIYTGPVKNICAPGLNCYSCPGAAAACPLGSLQNSLVSANKSTLYYVLGSLLLFGFLLGRWICGFLCPFGLIQELLHKIPTPKVKKSRVTRVLSYFKYVILAVFVVIIPLAYAFRNFPLPAFCKYICPAGTLEGALGLLSNQVNESKLSMLGPLFTWKFLLMVSILVACVFMFRFFCRFICPLGALYGLFNKISLVGLKVDKSACTDCGICVSHCKMDIRHVGDQECISCGECVSVCPTKAISWKGSQFFLAPNAIDPVPAPAEDATPAEVAEAEQAAVKAHEEKVRRVEKRNKIIKIAVAVVMVLALCFTLVYYNFIDKAVVPPAGTTVGSLCPEITLDPVGGGEQISIADLRGRVVLLNFWYTTCGPCVEELPHFNKASVDYASSVTIITIHIEMPYVDAAQWVTDNHPEWNEGNMLFTWDTGNFYKDMFGIQSFPTTIVIDADGEIVNRLDHGLTEAELIAAIEDALKKN